MAFTGKNRAIIFSRPKNTKSSLVNQSNVYDSVDLLYRANDRMAEYKQRRDLHFLVYAALDIRLFVERTLFEYLLLIKNDTPGKKLEKLYAAEDLKRSLLKLEPAFFRKIEFMRILVPFFGYDRSIVVPDLDLLSNAYRRLNNYLHAPKRPATTSLLFDWWQSLFNLLERTISHLEEIHSNHMGHIELSERGNKLLAQFSSGKLSPEELSQQFARDLKQRT
jgi:hypothetical protein